MAVNLRAMPAKGMTLPFISYGGSSLLALGLGMGFLIAATRKRPAADLDHPGAPRGMSAARSILLAAGRHGRPSLSRGGAGGGAREARSGSRARDRQPGAEIRRRFSRPRHSRLSGRDDHRRRRARQGARGGHAWRRARGRAGQAQAHQAARGGRLWRLSDRAAAPRRLAPRDSHRPARAERGDGPGQPLSELPRQPHRLRFSGLKGVDRGNRGEDAHDRQSGAPRRSSPRPTIPYPDQAGRRLNVLVTGGSQGARVMADVVPAALALLSPDERQWIRLTQQARGED